MNARGIPTAAYQIFHPRWGTPPSRGTPRSEGGNQGEVPLAGVPPHLDLAGYSPPHLDLAEVAPPGVDRQTDTCQNITCPRTTYAVGKNVSTGFLDLQQRACTFFSTPLLRISVLVMICCNTWQQVKAGADPGCSLPT